MSRRIGRSTVPVVVRVPIPVAERIDSIADSIGLNRSQYLRHVLSNVSADDVPEALSNAAGELRQALMVA